jgi:hypothetical protein
MDMREMREGRLSQLFTEMPEITRERYKESGESTIANLRPMMNVLLDRRLRAFRTDEQVENAINTCFNGAISHVGYLAFCRSEILEGNIDPLGALNQLMFNDQNHQFGKFWLSSLQRPEIMGILVETVRSEMRSIADGELERRRLATMTPEERRAHDDNVVREMDQFHRKRMEHLFRIASNRQHEFYATALDALQAEARHGNAQAAELLRRLGL